jgi:hypothetical protein
VLPPLNAPDRCFPQRVGENRFGSSAAGKHTGGAGAGKLKCNANAWLGLAAVVYHEYAESLIGARGGRMDGIVAFYQADFQAGGSGGWSEETTKRGQQQRARLPRSWRLTRKAQPA